MRRGAYLFPLALALVAGGCAAGRAPTEPLALEGPSFDLTATPGTAVSWGGDAHGVLSGTPTGTDFVAVAPGRGHSAALRANGTLASWGEDSWGRAGGTPAAADFVAVAAGG